VELQETLRLIKYYLELLDSKKAQRTASYRPTLWELITPQEQRARALARVKQNKQLRIAIFFPSTLSNVNTRKPATIF
jgi:hypothetical protein